MLALFAPLCLCDVVDKKFWKVLMYHAVWEERLNIEQEYGNDFVEELLAKENSNIL